MAKPQDKIVKYRNGVIDIIVYLNLREPQPLPQPPIQDYAKETRTKIKSRSQEKRT